MATIVTLHEGRRGCGHRKPGGLYLVGGELSEPCTRLPVPLDVCPVCHAGVKPTRSWTWIAPDPLLFPDGASFYHGTDRHMDVCPIGYRGRLGERCGVLWIGEAFYPTPANFMREGAAHGVSRRLSGIPKGLVLGETWILLAHRKAVEGVWAADRADRGEGPAPVTPGIFTVFRPTRLEYVVKDDDAADKLDRLEARGITLVRVVPAENWPAKVA